jgi:hypothetical protein
MAELDVHLREDRRRNDSDNEIAQLLAGRACTAYWTSSLHLANESVEMSQRDVHQSTWARVDPIIAAFGNESRF